jgi:uncharacterized lipoprotein YmbA
MIRRTLPILALLLLASGCGFFSRSKSRVYSIDTIPPTGGRVAVTGLPVGIAAVELPPGLDRRDIVVRQADQKLDVRDKDLWAAPFESMVMHALAFDLAERLPEGMVILPGQSRPAGATRSIDVIIDELSAGPENAIVVDARWIERGPANAELAHHEEFTIPLPSLESAEVARGMGQALATLADRIVAGL